MNYAYINNDGDVLALAQNILGYDGEEIPLSYIKCNPTARLDGVPDGLLYKGHSSGQFHRRDSGDGTDMGHYSVQDYVEPLQDNQVYEVDRKTKKLFSLGFPYAGKTFSLSVSAQNKWLSLYTLKDDHTYPIYVPTLDDKEIYQIDDAADLVSIYNAMNARITALVQGDNSLKKQIRDATTAAAVNAIVDSR